MSVPVGPPAPGRCGACERSGAGRAGRRSVLLGSVALAAGAAACAGPAVSPPPPPPTGSGGFATGVAPTSDMGGGAGTVLGPTAAVAAGSGVVYERFAVVVTRSTAGDLQGFSAVCPHDGCLVNEVAAGRIRCPCHGSLFGLDGSVVQGPARDPLTTRPVREHAGQVVLD